MRFATLFTFFWLLLTWNGSAQTFNFNINWPGGTAGLPNSVRICNGSTLTLTADSIPPGYTYSWMMEQYGCNSISNIEFATGTNEVTVSESSVYNCFALDSLGQMVGIGMPSIWMANTDDNGGICATTPTTICNGGVVNLKIIKEVWAGHEIQWQRNNVDITNATLFNYGATTAGTYRVKYMNWCDTTYSNDIVVTVSSPVATISGNTAFCPGSCVTLTASTGSSYNWNTGQTTQSISVCTAGVYTVTVSDNLGCTDTASVTVTTFNAPVPVITGNTSMCAGETTTLCVGPGYSSYLWSNGVSSPCITVNSAGVYTITVTDANGCTGSTTIVVTVNPLPAPEITGDSILCQSNFLDAGVGYLSYLWSTGAITQTISISVVGIYTVTVTNVFGCTGSDNFTVSAIPFTLTSSGTTSICSGDSVMLSAVPSLLSYQWYRNGLPIPGATNEHIWIKNAGNYRCYGIDQSGCDTRSNFQRVSIVCFPPDPAIDRLGSWEEVTNSITVFPNPSHDGVTISFNFPLEKRSEVYLMDAAGRTLELRTIEKNTSEFILTKRNPGIYILKIIDGSGDKLRETIMFY